MPFKTPGRDSEYIRAHLKPETDPLLSEMLEYADKNRIPVLLPESKAFLVQLVTLLKPAKTLEIGTAVGYSSQLILRNGGERLFTVEIDEGLASIAKSYFSRAGLSDRVNVFIGDASEIIPLMEGSFDFIFMDGPKTRYIEYLPHLMRMLKKGGTLLCDNVLWNGMVSGKNETQKNKTTIVHGLDKFITAICSDDRLITSILPVGDGMSLSIRKNQED